MYVTGASKVEKVYFASHALRTERIWQEMIIGQSASP